MMGSNEQPKSAIQVEYEKLSSKEFEERVDRIMTTYQSSLASHLSYPFVEFFTEDNLPVSIVPMLCVDLDKIKGLAAEYQARHKTKIHFFIRR